MGNATSVPLPHLIARKREHNKSGDHLRCSLRRQQIGPSHGWSELPAAKPWYGNPREDLHLGRTPAKLGKGVAPVPGPAKSQIGYRPHNWRRSP
jgi:hypothetical protein